LGLILRFRVGIRERWLEDIVKKTLRNAILVDAHPRTLVQVTLQVVATPREEDVLGGLAQADSVCLVVLMESRFGD
jgi:exosome complex component RRP46